MRIYLYIYDYEYRFIYVYLAFSLLFVGYGFFLFHSVMAKKILNFIFFPSTRWRRISFSLYIHPFSSPFFSSLIERKLRCSTRDSLIWTLSILISWLLRLWKTKKISQLRKTTLQTRKSSDMQQLLRIRSDLYPSSFFSFTFMILLLNFLSIYFF